MNIKKLFAVLAGVSMLATQLIPAGALAATYSAELEGAYNWAHDKGITTMSTIDNANMYGAITRAEMAKMLSVYATDVLGMSPDSSAACTFTDIDSIKGDLHDYIIESCQLGIMGQGITAFRPYDTISRAEFGTALSRVLWGSQYEGGTPYYAKHLEALRSAGIMTQIANAESTKEIRGYVMLMLQRSEGSDTGVDCDDPMTVIACTTDTDACPAACREAENEEPVIVKSGDLAVSAKASEGKRAIVPGISDLDTLTFRTSEDVTISKVVLERYGYSSADDVDEVRLEDQDGNVIADGKSLSKDKVTLSIKKDYRSVDGTYVATVVARLTGNNVGGTIGFKVVDADSTAKNLNLDDYTPYTYDMVQYSGANVTVDLKGSQDKNYNYEEGESYEIARLKVTAGKSIVSVRGFTLTNGSGLELGDYLDELTVTVDGEDVSGLKYSVNKDEQLVVSFDEIAVDMNKSKLFVIYASLEDFDDYGKTVAYYLATEADFNSVEKKTGARLEVLGNHNKADAVRHAFNGGKIKLSNNKLGNLDASQGTDNLVVAEGNVTVSEPISKLAFDLVASGSWAPYVTAVRMFVGGEEFEAKKSGTTFSFSNVEIAESSKIQFKLDIEDNTGAQGKVVQLTPNFNGDLFDGSRYDNSRDDVNTGDVAGTISFSQVTIQSANATLKNSLSKAVEYMNNDTNEGVVFDGTYTAKKANINLNKFYMSGAANPAKVKTTYYLYLNGKEVDSTDNYGTANEVQFKDVVVKAGESVSVKVIAEVEAYGSATTLSNIYLVLGWTDDFDQDVTPKYEKIMDIKIVDKGSVNITAGTVSKTVLYKAKNQPLAQFTVKPADGSSSVEVDSIQFILTSVGDPVTTDDVSVMFGNEELEPDLDGSTTFTYSDLSKTITSETTVKVMLDEEKTATITLSGFQVNDKTATREFVTRFEPAIVKISSADNLWWTTRFHFTITKDSDITVSNLKVWYDTTGVATGTVDGIVDSSSFIESKGIKDEPALVKGMQYDISSSDYVAGHAAQTWVCTYTFSGSLVSGYVLNWNNLDWTGDAGTSGSIALLGDSYTYEYATNVVTATQKTPADLNACPSLTDTTYFVSSNLTTTWYAYVATSGMPDKTVCICKEASCGCTDTASYADYFLLDGAYAKVFASNSK